MSSISRLRSPVFWCTASRVSSCSASSTSPLRPTNLVRSSLPSMLTIARLPSTSEIDVAVEVQQVQQLLQIVAGDLALGDQPLFQILGSRARRSSPSLVGLRRCGCPSVVHLPVVQRPSCASLRSSPGSTPSCLVCRFFRARASPGAASVSGAPTGGVRSVRARAVFGLAPGRGSRLPASASRFVASRASAISVPSPVISAARVLAAALRLGARRRRVGARAARSPRASCLLLPARSSRTRSAAGRTSRCCSRTSRR